MAGGEHEAKQIVADVVVDRLVNFLECGFLLGIEIAADLRVFALGHLVPAQPVDGAALGGGRQPGAGFVGNARRRPLLERGEQRVLCQLLGEADVAHHAGEAGDDFRLLDPPDRVDRAMDVGRRCIGSHRGYRYTIVGAPAHEGFMTIRRVN